MKSDKKKSLLAMANSAMRTNDYLSAISLYKSAGYANPLLIDDINFNISLAENRLRRQAQKTELLDLPEITNTPLIAIADTVVPSSRQTEAAKGSGQELVTPRETAGRDEMIFAVAAQPVTVPDLSSVATSETTRKQEGITPSGPHGMKILTTTPSAVDSPKQQDECEDDRQIAVMSLLDGLNPADLDVTSPSAIQGGLNEMPDRDETLLGEFRANTIHAGEAADADFGTNLNTIPQAELPHNFDLGPLEVEPAVVPKKNIRYALTDTTSPTMPGIQGHIDVVDDDFVHGWICDLNNPNDVIKVDLYLDDVRVATASADIIRNDVMEAVGVKATCGFSIEHGRFTKLLGGAELRLYIAGTDQLAFPQIIEISSLSAHVTAISKLAKIIKRELALHSDPSMVLLSTVYIPKLMEKTRSGEVEIAPRRMKALNHLAAPRPKMVSVIIPVYEGYDETLNCIDSVLMSKNDHAYNLIVINDCSPNTKLTHKLRRHSKKHGYTLVENDYNLGFVGTVNRGIRAADKDDVILLNSDTLVPDGWLDQLLNIAYLDPIIGTVTPFSNNATICSYPNFCQDNHLPAGHDVNSLNKLFQKFNNSKSIDIPTAHGFCVLIKRATINEVGMFDEQKWGKGYAEENDFSLRAEQRGWRNVFALDTFVQHLGSVSFASNTNEFVRKNLEILNGIYPDYAERVSQFIHNDPARVFRNAISRNILDSKIARLGRGSSIPGNFILLVSLTIGGGTKIATDDISKHLAKEGAHTLMLTSPSPDVWRLSYDDADLYLDYKIPEDHGNLINDLRAFGVWHVNFHNTLEFGKGVWELPNQLNCQYDVTIHDYHSICPRVNLIDETRKYCGEPTLDVCNSCIGKNGAHESSVLQLDDFNSDIRQWRAYYATQLRGARKIFVPSVDLGKRLEKYFSGLSFEHRPHPEPVKNITILGPTSEGIVNVAFLGAIGIHKGYDYLKGCAEYALKSNLPIHFHVIGYTKDDQGIGTLTNVNLYGKYQKPDLPGLLKKSACTVAAILSVWPETYSYTLSEALDAGLKVLTFDLGAPAERLQPGCGVLVNLEDSYEAICNEILDVSLLPSVKITTGKRYDSFLMDYYEFGNSAL